MKKVLLVMVGVLMISSVAMADHFGVYTDNTGSSCLLAPGFTSGATVIEKFSAGSTGSRFKVSLPAGTQFFSFSTGFTPVGDIRTDLAVGYGVCIPGDIVIGTLVAILTPGTIQVLPSDGGFANIIYTDCGFAEKPATGGTAHVGEAGGCNEVATEPSTWGQVKALYR
jgi:hypothetical protein